MANSIPNHTSFYQSDYDRWQATGAGGNGVPYIHPTDGLLYDKQFSGNARNSRVQFIINSSQPTFTINGNDYSYVSAEYNINLTNPTRTMDKVLDRWIDGIQGDANYQMSEGLLLNWERTGITADILGVYGEMTYDGILEEPTIDPGDIGDKIIVSKETFNDIAMPTNTDTDTRNYDETSLPQCDEDDIEGKDYMVVGDAYNGVRDGVLETSNREVPFMNLLPEYLTDFQYAEVYRFFECYFNTMFKVEREKKLVVTEGDTTNITEHSFISLLEKINRIRDFDNAMEIDWNLISAFAKERGFEFAMYNHIKDDITSVNFKKSIRGLLDALPHIFSIKGTAESIRTVFSLLGFYVDVGQRYYEVEYYVIDPKSQMSKLINRRITTNGLTNCEVGVYENNRRLNDADLKFLRDIYTDKDELDLLETRIDYRFSDLLNDGEVIDDQGIDVASVGTMNNRNLPRLKIKHSPIYDFNLVLDGDDIENAPQKIQVAIANLDKVRPINAVFNIDSLAIDLGTLFTVHREHDVSVLIEDMTDAQAQGLIFLDEVANIVTSDAVTNLRIKEIADANGIYYEYTSFVGVSNVQDVRIVSGTSSGTTHVSNNNYSSDNTLAISAYDNNSIQTSLFQPNISTIPSAFSDCFIDFKLFDIFGKHYWTDYIDVRIYPIVRDWVRAEATGEIPKIGQVWGDGVAVPQVIENGIVVDDGWANNTKGLKRGFDYLNDGTKPYGAYDITRLYFNNYAQLSLGSTYTPTTPERFQVNIYNTMIKLKELYDLSQPNFGIYMETHMSLAEDILSDNVSQMIRFHGSLTTSGVEYRPEIYFS